MSIGLAKIKIQTTPSVIEDVEQIEIWSLLEEL